MERQDDLVFGNALFYQAIGDAFLGAIVLDPDLAALDVHVQDAPVEPPLGRQTMGTPVALLAVDAGPAW